MSQFVTLYQASNGFLVGWIGADPTEVLHQIESDFGPGAADHVGEATAEMAEILAGSAATADSPRPVAPGPADQPAGGVANSPAPEPVEAPAAETVSTPVVGEGRDEPAPPAAEASSADAGPACGICGAGVTEARAEVSIEEYGEPRCKSCSAT